MAKAVSSSLGAAPVCDHFDHRISGWRGEDLDSTAFEGEFRAVGAHRTLEQ
jgi:hypothetical protein